MPRFVLLLLLRLALILGNMFLFLMILDDNDLFFSKVILVLLFAGQVAELIHAINHTNRELTRLINAIRYSDFTVSFDRKSLGFTFRDLQESMTGLASAFREVKAEREGQFLFLQKLVNQMAVGVVVLKNEEIELINPAAQELLNAEGVKSWSLLKALRPDFATALVRTADAGHKMLELPRDGAVRIMAMEVGTIIILNEEYKLVTLQDINSEIEQKEIEAWHKLVRILTHEIMNSVTPVASLTETIEGMLSDKEGRIRKASELSDDVVEDIRFSIRTVRRRSEGLLNFVDSYRKVTRVPRPVKVPVKMRDLLTSLSTLLEPELKRDGITLNIEVDDQLVLQCDRILIEQVLINLISNSVHALEDHNNKRIDLKTSQRGGYTMLEVVDNGKGIREKELREIFVPFFTTRPDGSGIGLSLSKQIMIAHGGSIRAESTEGKGARFVLEFRS